MEPAVQVASGVFFTLWTNRILYNFLDIITLCLEAYERISKIENEIERMKNE